ncbi:MAG: phosphosulfolactate synthase [Nitrosopumilus sp.]|nr:phosphosulfolactate synthase [Nitrosopumilus sp.]
MVSTGSTLTEYALRKNAFKEFVEESKLAGFDIIEINENNTLNEGGFFQKPVSA